VEIACNATDEVMHSLLCRTAVIMIENEPGLIKLSYMHKFQFQFFSGR